MRIAIVNDTIMALEGLKRIINATTEHEVAWLAQDGMEAITKCTQDTPDLILMDLIMPNMDGVEATKQIMQRSPCAILIVTSTVTGNTAQVFEAMGAGALDAVNTPVIAEGNPDNGTQPLLKKIATIAMLIRGDIAATPNNFTKPSSLKNDKSTLIAIGSSTGGPKALAQILRQLPADINAAIVVIQHVDTQFSRGFASWLGEQCSLPVRLAENNEPPRLGTVLIANSDRHLTLNKNGRLIYDEEPPQLSISPIGKCILYQCRNALTGEAIGVLLTGMGKDGASGLNDMHRRGFPTIAQDKSSCAVYGMPKAAVELKAG